MDLSPQDNSQQDNDPLGATIVESTKPNEEPDAETGRLVFSTYGHVLGLADGVLFGAKRPPPRQRTRKQPPAATKEAPTPDQAHKVAQGADGDAPGS